MHFLITAGPTREPLDPVRYLTNRSEFQGQISSARLVYNLDKYNLFPMFIQLEAHYYVAFDDDYVDGFYFGGSVNFRF